MRLALASSVIVAGLAAAVNGKADSAEAAYEVWACDQSNSVANAEALGTTGSLLWIWDSHDVDRVVSPPPELSVERSSATAATPPSKPCTPDADSGPCDLLAMFHPDLVDSVSGVTLAEAGGFGRWHGITRDPQNKYVTANIFAPGGGYLGIVDAETKEAVALFRATLMTYAAPTDEDPDATKTTRNVHMSFWNDDGSAIVIHNLAGKAVERINIERDEEGKITAAAFDKSATMGVGKSMSVAEEASFFEGTNAFGRPLLGGVTGSYDDADLGELTPSGQCKEDGCASAAEGDDFDSPGRPNNVPICPVMASNGLTFNTFGGGGLLVTDSKQTPMAIVGEHGNKEIYGAGVCGESVADTVYFTSGNSASGAGITHSMWALWGFDPDELDAPSFAFEFPGTATGGRTEGVLEDTSGQVPGESTRRDAHDLAGTVDGKYVHVVDRIEDVIDVFDTATGEHVGAYSLVSADGGVEDHVAKGGGACEATSVTDGGEGFPVNNPGADFIMPTPDGKYMMLSLRGPAPVSATHSAQGSCPGVGIVELKEGGKSGALVGVLRSTNLLPDAAGVVSPAGGYAYPGTERSDIHDVVVVAKASADAPSTAPPGEPGTSAGSARIGVVSALVGGVAVLYATIAAM
ncbi:hypothetical protein ACHAXT_009035 [Thalassiosira profunda]